MKKIKKKKSKKIAENHRKHKFFSERERMPDIWDAVKKSRFFENKQKKEQKYIQQTLKKKTPSCNRMYVCV